MATNLERYKADLLKLLDLGKAMSADLFLRSEAEKQRLSDEQKKAAGELQGTFEARYQRWYSEALAVIRQMLPARLTEFESLYKGDGKRKDIGVATYTIQDWLLGVRVTTNKYSGEKPFDDLACVAMRFNTQVNILAALNARFESSLFDIRQLVQADLFDSEIDVGRELLKSGFVRAAGVVAGVVLERHLQEVCSSHNVTVRKKHPTIGDLNDALKDASVIDIPTWRQFND